MTVEEDDGLSDRRRVERRAVSDRRASNRRRRGSDADELVTITAEEVVQTRLTPPPLVLWPPNRWRWPWDTLIRGEWSPWMLTQHLPHPLRRVFSFQEQRHGR